MLIKPALGTNIKDCASDILDGKLWRITSKIDGVRRLFYKSKDGTITVFSRTGKIDTWLTHITDFLEPPWFPEETVYDCELVDRHLYLSHAPSFVLRAETTGKASQQFMDHKLDLMAICFDIFDPSGDLRIGKERHLELTHLFAPFSLADPMIMVPTYGNIYGTQSDILTNLMKMEIQNNGEGLMLMDMAAPYIPGRSKSILKMKRCDEFKGVIIDVELARAGTKIENGVAAVICKIEGCTTPVRVGSGFTHEERLQMAFDRELIGKEIEIEAFDYSRNKQGLISLNLPVFKRFIF